jgi:hypothetical protein
MFMFCYCCLFKRYYLCLCFFKSVIMSTRGVAVDLGRGRDEITTSEAKAESM